MKKCSIFAVVAGVAGLLHAAPRFFVPETLYAAPGVECNVFFARIFESVKYSNYAFEAISEEGNFWEDRWSWTPKAEDAGKSVQVVFRAHSDDGLVDCATTTVAVAKSPAADLKSRRISLALLTASCSNCRFQDRLPDFPVFLFEKNYDRIKPSVGPRLCIPRNLWKNMCRP